MSFNFRWHFRWRVMAAGVALLAGAGLMCARGADGPAGTGGAATMPAMGGAGATSVAASAAISDKTTVIVAVGIAGEAEYGEDFARAADLWQMAAKKAGAEFVSIGRDAVESNKDEKDESQDIDKSKLHAAIDAAIKENGGPLWLALIGHGTFDGKEAKFNLRGSDVSDSELAAWLKPCTRPLAVIDCSSASTPFMSKLAGKGRVIVTATRTGQEINYARFGTYFAAAIGDPAADIDKDGEVSLLEAFLSASHGVAEFYKGEGRIMTEHALLDDNGDGLGVNADWFEGVRATGKSKDGKPVDGTRAHQWALIHSDAEAALPAELRARRNELELAVEALHLKKGTMPEEAYYTQLDGVLVELAKVYGEADKAGVGGGKVSP